MFKMVKKMQNSGFEIVAGVTRPFNSLRDQIYCARFDKVK